MDPILRDVIVAAITGVVTLGGGVLTLRSKLAELKRDVGVVKGEVKNSHKTNLRDDLDNLHKSVDKLHETTTDLRADVLDIKDDTTSNRAEIRAVADKAAETQHAHLEDHLRIYRRIADLASGTPTTTKEKTDAPD